MQPGRAQGPIRNAMTGCRVRRPTYAVDITDFGRFGGLRGLVELAGAGENKMRTRVLDQQCSDGAKGVH